MGKKKKEEECPPVAAWLVTFSDLVTLLLTFFVLLLSMASMDQTFLTQVNVTPAEMGNLDKKGAGRVPQRVKFVVPMLERPLDVMDKPNRIKDLLFPDDVLPPQISKAELDENLKVLAKPEGVALVFTDKILFPLGGSKLSDAAIQLLRIVEQPLSMTSAEVNIAGYADGLGGYTRRQYELSGRRALSVLEVFVKDGLPNSRFSVSPMGPLNPIATNRTEEGRAQNRRVEILVKTRRDYPGL
ncbi:MAG: OmpA/MotB family protein [Desulfovibrio sp.]